MRRSILMLLAVLAAMPSADAARKKPSAGTIQEGVYRDSKYGFELKMSENWKAIISKDEDNLRLALVQRNYGIPPRYQNAPDYTVIPRIAVFADTSTLGAAAMLDSLLSQTCKSKQKKEILKEFEFLNLNDIIPRNRKFTQVAGEAAVVWEGTVKYVKDISTSTSDVGGVRESGAYGGAVITTKKGNTILLFHLMCEDDFYNDVMKDALGIVNSLSWPKPTE
ncbi:MAG: hypothetical protein AB1644_02000 [Candidatus Zixiibacteriota bacterium]